ncbi:endonuclease NucS domain-containing protein [Hyphomonas sp.]|uniref:endonuclease NucS domain-containing protein n=1 Tax=Hyphomonas sp. TaxID=87 RepID=UPI0030023D23
MSATKQYYRVMLGPGSCYAEDGVAGRWIGADWSFDFDLSDKLLLEREEFKRAMRPIFLENNPDKTKVAAGLAAGMLYTICRDMKAGDLILTPDSQGSYFVGTIAGSYYFADGEDIPHRRRVDWYPGKIDRSSMSQELRNSTGSVGTVSNVTKYAAEIDAHIKGDPAPVLVATDELVEDPSVFALEQHLEHFLIQNWPQTELGQRYNIFEEDGEIVGQQYPSDTGPIDILAISKDRKELLVVELKRGRASDAVVGQIQRYMGYVKDELISEGQSVRGAIIALEDDLRLKRALSVTQGIDFYRYQVSFRLLKGAA